MCDIIEVTDLDAPELDVYARLTQAQLRSRREPEKGIFIAESPKVIGHALDAGCVPLSLLMERRQLEGQGRDLVERCGQVPVYTGDRAVLAGLTGYELTRASCAPCAGPGSPLWRSCAPGPAGWRCWRASWTPPMWGAIFRSAAALHMDAVLVTPTCCDPLSRRAVRVSMGTRSRSPGLFWAPTHPSGPSRAGEAEGAGLPDCGHGPGQHRPQHRGPPAPRGGEAGHPPGDRGGRPGPRTIAQCDFTVCIPMARGWTP